MQKDDRDMKSGRWIAADGLTLIALLLTLEDIFMPLGKLPVGERLRDLQLVADKTFLVSRKCSISGLGSSDPVPYSQVSERYHPAEEGDQCVSASDSYF